MNDRTTAPNRSGTKNALQLTFGPRVSVTAEMRADARAFDLAQLRRQWRRDDAEATRSTPPQVRRASAPRRRLARPRRRCAAVGDDDDGDERRPLFVTVAELYARVDEELRERTRALLAGDGQWRLDLGNWTLQHRWYEVDLEDLTTPAKLLDWIFQIRQKTWCDSQCLHDLLGAIDHLIQPQATLCGGGLPRLFDRERIRARVAKIVSEAVS